MTPTTARAIGAGVAAALLWIVTAVLAHVPPGARPASWILQVLVPGPLQDLTRLPVTPQAVVVGSGALVIGVLVAGAAALVRGAARVPAVWLVVPLAALAVGMLMGAGQIIGLAPRLGVSFPAADVARSLGGQAWGLLAGWIPALVAGWVDDAPARRIPVIVVAAAAPVLAVVLVVSAAVAAPLPYQALDRPPVSSGPTPVRTSPDVPPPAPATPPAQRYAVATTDCPVSQLGLDASGGGAATGHRVYDFQIRNTSALTCTITGYPGIAFRGARDRATAANVAPGGSFMEEDPGPAPVTLAPGATAIAGIGWDAGAEPNDATRAQRVALTIATELPSSAVSSASFDIVDGTAVTVTAWRAGALDVE
jgi:hypothetical protein